MSAEPAFATRRRALLEDGASIAACWLAIAIVFVQTRHFDFINFDDPGYVTGNAEVLRGLDPRSIGWAFTTLSEGHYHPLTWLSHMAVVEAFGAAPGPAHLVNVALHALATALLYLLFARTTGQPRSALAAALLFAIHPLRAESVAWVTERKDVLSTALWLGSLLCYVEFVRSGSIGRWLGALACFALGLLAKPMLVTLPLTMLLLDHWPLRRVSLQRFDRWKHEVRRPALEKAPFVALALASGLATWIAQARAGAMPAAAEHGIAARLANASTGYLAYLGQWLWPAELSIFHPLRPIPAGLGVAAALALGLLSGAIWRARDRAAALAIGWAWYVITLVPVIGIIQVGGQARADRFTYVPSIGLGIIVLWGLPSLFDATRWLSLRWQRAAVSVGLAALAAWSHVQVSHFQDSESIWRHALATDPDNFMAHNNLGVALDAQGRFEESEPHFREAVRLNPTYPPARTNLGSALARRGAYAPALEQFAIALERQPALSAAHYNLGLALARLGRYDEAARRYRAALELAPADAMAHYSLGALLIGRGQRDEGAAHLHRALSLRPHWSEPRAMLDRLRAVP